MIFNSADLSKVICVYILDGNNTFSSVHQHRIGTTKDDFVLIVFCIDLRSYLTPKSPITNAFCICRFQAIPQDIIALKMTETCFNSYNDSNNRNNVIL